MKDNVFNVCVIQVPNNMEETRDLLLSNLMQKWAKKLTCEAWTVSIYTNNTENMVWFDCIIFVVSHGIPKYSKLKLLRGQGSLANILIKSEFIVDEIYKITNSLIIVDVNKNITRACTSWLEKLLHQMLRSLYLKTEFEGLDKYTSKVIAEIKFIYKQC